MCAGHGALLHRCKSDGQVFAANQGTRIRRQTPATEAALIYSGSGKFSPLFSEGQFVFTELRKAMESQS